MADWTDPVWLGKNPVVTCYIEKDATIEVGTGVLIRLCRLAIVLEISSDSLRFPICSL